MKLKEGGLKIVTFMWDGEDRAIDDAIEASLMLKAVGLVARVAILPQDKDPNEVPGEVVRKAFYQAVAITPATATRLRLKKR